jgi:hypothetical protein
MLLLSFPRTYAAKFQMKQSKKRWDGNNDRYAAEIEKSNAPGYLC